MGGIIMQYSMNSTIRSDDRSSTIVKIIAAGQYDPENVTVVLGVNNTVSWVNGDLVAHTITSDSGLFDSGLLSPGQDWSFTFIEPGSYTYHCSLHSWMKGVVNVIAGSR
jgi:plastocyanin